LGRPAAVSAKVSRHFLSSAPSLGGRLHVKGLAAVQALSAGEGAVISALHWPPLKAAKGAYGLARLKTQLGLEKIFAFLQIFRYTA
jgi:hypothetical protein